MDKAIDVIMPVWLINEDLVRLTEAAVASLVPRKRLIIIDNGSPLGGGKMRELADVYIRNKENLGYAKAVNQGMKLADPVAAIANNDIVVSPNWYEVAQEAIEDPTVATLHFKMIPYDAQFEHGTELSRRGRERWCSGSFFIKTKNALFDENFLNSYDDWDYQVRARAAGYCTAYTNRASYAHLDSSSQQFVVKRDDNNNRNREYFKTKHGEYPEDLYLRLFADQMSQPWKPFP